MTTPTRQAWIILPSMQPFSPQCYRLLRSARVPTGLRLGYGMANMRLISRDAAERKRFASHGPLEKTIFDAL
jgi:hypothetical protein